MFHTSSFRLSWTTSGKKKENKCDGEAAEFQSRDHPRPARLQAASLGGFPCHSYPTGLHLLPGPPLEKKGGGILGKLERLQQLGRTENIGFFSGSWEKPQPSANIRGGARTALRWEGGGVLLRHGFADFGDGAHGRCSVQVM